MGTKVGQNSTCMPKSEVGEIDTRAPFESVKAAVSLFDDTAFSADKSASNEKKEKTTSAERTLAKERELHLARKRLNELKEQLNNAETTRIQALSELARDKKTIEELTQKLNAVNEFKESALKATEAAKVQAEHLEGLNPNEQSANDVVWKKELVHAREQYAVVNAELNSAKHEVGRIRSDLEASIAANVSASHQEAEAKLLSSSNSGKAAQLSKDIAVVQGSLEHVKFSIEEAQKEESKIIYEKTATRQSYKQALEEAEEKLASLGKEFDPEQTVNLEEKLAQTTADIGSLQKEIENAKVSDSTLVTTVTAELDGAKEVLQKIAEEKCSLESLVKSLRMELEYVKKEHCELKEKDAETECIVGSLHAKIQKSKDDVEAAVAAESKATSASNELISIIQQLSSESRSALRDTEEMVKDTDELRHKAEAARLALDNSEKSLQVALKEAEEAKVVEYKALDKIKELSEKANVTRDPASEFGNKVTISKEEFESLNLKVEEYQKLADMKVAATMALVEAVKASENEAIKRLEAIGKEMDEIEIATEQALKRAYMAESAKKAVEGELRRWREREQKRAAEPAVRVLAEAQLPLDSSSTTRSQSTKVLLSEKVEVEQQVNRLPAAPRKALLRNLSDLFHRKRDDVFGASTSYLPGEKPI